MKASILLLFLRMLGPYQKMLSKSMCYHQSQENQLEGIENADMKLLKIKFGHRKHHKRGSLASVVDVVLVGTTEQLVKYQYSQSHMVRVSLYSQFVYMFFKLDLIVFHVWLFVLQVGLFKYASCGV